MVEYSYDAWGNCKIIKDTDNIATYNPYRYRGYYYDEETGLYYLQTRYYDPRTGRFLNADSVEYADPERINGLNLYAYCGNNPVMNVDPTGQFAISTTVAIGLTVAALAAAVLGWIETTYHPIQNAIQDIGNAIGDLANDISINLGNSVSNSTNISQSQFITDAGTINTAIGNIYLSRDRNRGRDSEFIDLSDEDLEDELNDAKRNNDSLRIQRILREMKIRGMRNKRKQRGGPHMRGFILLLLGGILSRYNEK